MNPELEALLKAFDAYMEAGKFDSPEMSRQYSDLLRSTAEKTRAEVKTLDTLVRYKHARWKLAQRKPPIIPPTA